MFRFEIIGMFAMIVSISVSSIVAEGAFMFLCLFISLRKSSSDSICFTFRITVVLFFFFFFCFLRCTCLMCLSRLWESLHVFEHWAQRNSCVVDSFSVLTNVPNPMFDFTFCTTLGEVKESFVLWIFLCLVNFFWYGNDFPHSGQIFVVFGSFSKLFSSLRRQTLVESSFENESCQKMPWMNCVKICVMIFHCLFVSYFFYIFEKKLTVL